MPGKFPVDRGLELDEQGNPIVWNVGNTETPPDFAEQEAPFCPVEAVLLRSLLLFLGGGRVLGRRSDLLLFDVLPDAYLDVVELAGELGLRGGCTDLLDDLKGLEYSSWQVGLRINYDRKKPEEEQ